MVGDEQCASTYQVYRSHAELSVLICVLSGSAKAFAGDNSWELGPGDILTFPQGTSYGYMAVREDPWRVLWFNMTGTLYPLWLSQYGLDDCPVYRGANPEILQEFWTGVNLCRSGLGEDELQDGLCKTVYTILLKMWRQYCIAREKESPAGKIKRRIDQMISETPWNRFSLSEEAEKLGISSRQLERLYQEEFSMTPYQYFQQQKLALAKQYLSNTRLSVKEISQRLGFCDPYYFSNCFKKAEGCSPKTYRSF